VAQQYDAELVLVHAIPPEPWETASLGPLPHDLDLNRLEAERAMEQIAEEAHLTRFRHRIERGSVGNALRSVTQHEVADLLVLGTHGRGGLKKLALGSVAEEVLRLASCPVLTVGPKAILPSADSVQFKTVLFATDFGSACAKAFRYALSFAENCKAQLILLHIADPIRTINVGLEPLDLGGYLQNELAGSQAEMREQSARKLWKLIPSDARLAVVPKYMVETGFQAEGILNASATYKADLIVMGANEVRSPRFASHIPWAVTHQVLCEARCPVLTLRN